ncbi:hypothetical protein CPB86DRAFT_800829 [Serendipita vermifera]|nr:hypothetical protein CPB86DRAFT_800829 [Serendipita vermifera]
MSLPPLLIRPYQISLVNVNGTSRSFFASFHAPDPYYLIENVSGGTSAYNKGLHSHVSSTIANTPAGAQSGALWVTPSAEDKRPTTGESGLKVVQDRVGGFIGSDYTAYIDDLLVTNTTLDMALYKIELHCAKKLLDACQIDRASGAQFYTSCAQVNITGSCSFPQPTPSVSKVPTIQTILITNGGSNSGSGSGGGSSSQNPTPTSSASGSGQTLYGQCGGQGWSGPTTCSSGTCKASNEWYSQCVP